MSTQVADISEKIIAPPSECIICTEDLWKTYQMGSTEIHAVQGVTMSIKRNEYVAIMGTSGSGKSTLMNLIGCLDSPSKGQYWINGRLVSPDHAGPAAATFLIDRTETVSSAPAFRRGGK